jgi:hypothetical protein
VVLLRRRRSRGQGSKAIPRRARRSRGRWRTFWDCRGGRRSDEARLPCYAMLEHVFLSVCLIDGRKNWEAAYSLCLPPTVTPRSKLRKGKHPKSANHSAFAAVMLESRTPGRSCATRIDFYQHRPRRDALSLNHSDRRPPSPGHQPGPLSTPGAGDSTRCLLGSAPPSVCGRLLTSVKAGLLTAEGGL